jgi:hypothetical protein
LKAEDIKKAAEKLNDQERIPLIIAELGSAPFTINVGNMTVNVPADAGFAIRNAVVDYLQNIATGIDLELQNMGVEGQEQFDLVLDGLVEAAKPNGHPGVALGIDDATDGSGAPSGSYRK